MTGPLTYVYPTTRRVVHGDGAVAQLGAECDSLGASRVVLLTTASLLDTPLLRTVVDALGDRLVATHSESTQHVPLETVSRLIAADREHDPDLLVSFGGGSVIDGGKALVAARAQGYPDAGQLREHRIVFDPPAELTIEPLTGTPIPHLAIPTTLSAAEYDGIFGMTHEGTKDLYNDPRLAPQVVLLDPAMTISTPPALWAGTGIRALDHAVEIYLSRTPSPVTDASSLHTVRLLAEHLPASMQDPPDLTARLRCQQAAWLSMLGVDNVTLGLCHGIGHQIGARCNVPHGVTSCVMLPTVLDELVDVAPARMSDLAVALGVERGGRPDRELAAELGPRVRSFVDGLGLPTRLSEVGVTEADFELIVRDSMRDFVVAFAPIEVDEQRILALLQKAW